jgi:hypothetical protein
MAACAQGGKQMSEDDTRERLARLEAVVGRSLELLSAGLAEEAQRELARVAGPASTPPDVNGGISELELEEAFQSARAETEQMRDADQVAREALLATGEHVPELDTPPPWESSEDSVWEHGEPAESELPPSFATATMAELLESQGDSEGASRIRAGLAGRAAHSTPRPTARPGRRQVVETLELWLDNVRRERA